MIVKNFKILSLKTRIKDLLVKSDFYDYIIVVFITIIAGYLFISSNGMFGVEHILSISEVSRGNKILVDHFDHHGFLPYFIMAIPFKILGDYHLFFIWIIFLGVITILFLMKLFNSLYTFSKKEKILLYFSLIWFLTSFYFFTIIPEPLIALIVVLIYLVLIFKSKFLDKFKFYLIGFLFTAILLIKYNCFIFLSAGSVIYLILYYLKFYKLPFTFKDVVKFLLGAFIITLPFLLYYLGNYKEVFYWLFTFNTKIVLLFAKEWPPHLFGSSIFFIFLVELIILVSLFFEKNKKYLFIFIFPLITSTCMLLISYPRYGDEHLLPSLPGLFLGMIIFYKEKLYLFYKEKFINFKGIFFWVIIRRVLLIILFILLLIFSVIFLVVSVKKNYRTIIPKSPSYFYKIKELSKNTKKELDNCNYVYVYPPLSFVYLELPNKRIKYTYENFSWSSVKIFEKEILTELEQKKVGCIIEKRNFLDQDIRSSMLENYFILNYNKTGELRLIATPSFNSRFFLKTESIFTDYDVYVLNNDKKGK